MSMSRQTSLKAGNSSNNLLRQSNPPNLKILAQRHASQPPVGEDDKFQQTQIMHPYQNFPDDGDQTQGNSSRRQAKTPIVPQLNMNKLNNPKSSPVSVSPFPQTGITLAVNTSNSNPNYLTAQNVTSLSNNAFIAKNYLLPGRASMAAITKSSRSPSYHSKTPEGPFHVH